MMMSLGLVFLFISISFNFSTGYLVHYANYMASRSYLVADSHGPDTSEDTSRIAAEKTFRKYNLSRVDVPESSLSINSLAVQGTAHMYTGTKVTFEKLLSYVRYIGGKTKAKFRSESFLGKEPTRNTCLTRTCWGITGNEVCDNANDITVEDNGC
jgi:hypothetical protein